MLNVLYQFNEKYAPYAGTSITSLFTHHKDEDVLVYILGEGLSEDSVKRFEALSAQYDQQIRILDTAPVIEKVKAWGIPAYRGAYSANLRLFLPYFLDEDVERILYLDADTIVRGSVKPLYDLDLSGKTIAMILDSLGRAYKRKQLGFSEEKPYYNSGVILFDLKKWRREGWSEKIITHVTNNEWIYTSPDQDLLNVVCADAIMTVPAKFNYQPVHAVFSDRTYFNCYGRAGYYTEEELALSREDVRIYHSLRFVGEFPWDAASVHPYTKLFDRYLRRSPWSDYQKEKAESTPAMKVEKFLYRILPKSLYLRLFVFFHNRYLNARPEADRSKQTV